MGRADDAYEWYEDEEAADAWRRHDETAGARPLELVRPAPARVQVVTPDDFEAAQAIADHLRRDRLVIVDLRGCTDDLAGRLTDFCSGLVYALGGGLQHVADDVLLLAPRHVDVSGDEACDVRPPGFYNRS
jgi:cell division inhibitor SepF